MTVIIFRRLTLVKVPTLPFVHDSSDNLAFSGKRNIMARTRTPVIRIGRDGQRIIDKEHRGVGIYLRLGPASQEWAEQRLADEIAKVDADLERDAIRVRGSRTVRRAISRNRKTSARWIPRQPRCTPS